MERVFRAIVFAGVATLAACGTVEPNEAHASSHVSRPSGPDVDTSIGPAVPDEIHGILPRGAEVLAVSRGDINADGRPDVVVAFDANPAGASPREPRSMVLLVRD